MRKLFCLILTVMLVFGTAAVFTACGGSGGGGGGGGGGGDDAGMETFVCGVTIYPPMSDQNPDGSWTGFDTEFAQLVAERLGMNVEFQMIDWSLKFVELDSGAIDAIWNGFTATAMEADGTPRINLADMSYSYMTNTQSVVVREERLAEFTSQEDLMGKTIAVEAGSAGETKAIALVGDDGDTVGAPKQINTFLEVKSGAADGAIIDMILAMEIVGSGDFADLAIADIDMGHEVFAIGFRRGDPFRDQVNAVMLDLYNEGTLGDLAEKWGLSDRFTVDTSFGR